MKTSALLLLLATTLLGAGQPLRVVSVERTGLPPYEDSQKHYRIEGDGCENLAPGETLTLRRPSENLRIGKLKVSAVKSGYALATVASEGETYPLRGDLVVRHERLLLIPELPPFGSARFAEDLKPVDPKIPEELQKLSLQRLQSFASAPRDPIFFPKNESTLSPGALRKLQAWVVERGAKGQWFLMCPERFGEAASLRQDRVEALRAELLRLGVEKLEVHSAPAAETGKYDAIYVGKLP